MEKGTWSLSVVKRSSNRNRELSGERFSWSEVRRGVLDIQTWLSASAYFGILSGLYSFGLFVSRMNGFADDRADSCLASNNHPRPGSYRQRRPVVVCHSLCGCRSSYR